MPAFLKNERTARMKSRFVACLVFVCLAASAVRASDRQDDLKSRRARVMERLGPESILILFSAPEKVYSNDINYEYRQDSNLYYLTGIDQPETILVLMPGNQERKEILFVSTSNPVREHWNGHVLTEKEAVADTGIATVYT